MAVMYPASLAKQLLEETNADGVTIRRWADDNSEIIMKSEAELYASLKALRLTIVNDHGIHLWEESGGDVVQRSAEAIAADEYAYTVANFSIPTFQGGLFSLLPSLSNPNLRFEFGAINSFAQNRDFAGMVQYLEFLLNSQIATQQDIDSVKALVTAQGIIL